MTQMHQTKRDVSMDKVVHEWKQVWEWKSSQKTSWTGVYFSAVHDLELFILHKSFGIELSNREDKSTWNKFHSKSNSCLLISDIRYGGTV